MKKSDWIVGGIGGIGTSILAQKFGFAINTWEYWSIFLCFFVGFFLGGFSTIMHEDD